MCINDNYITLKHTFSLNWVFILFKIFVIEYIWKMLAYAYTVRSVHVFRVQSTQIHLWFIWNAHKIVSFMEPNSSKTHSSTQICARGFRIWLFRKLWTFFCSLLFSGFSVFSPKILPLPLKILAYAYLVM